MAKNLSMRHFSIASRLDATEIGTFSAADELTALHLYANHRGFSDAQDLAAILCDTDEVEALQALLTITEVEYGDGECRTFNCPVCGHGDVHYRETVIAERELLGVVNGTLLIANEEANGDVIGNAHLWCPICCTRLELAELGIPTDFD